ncbi:MAG: DUF4097 domain-containing protein, partial [Actinobacteria bacterium]|nr:DUF4097 domain-containing protein [Actinomycetota bacterium]NIS28632.1 DUF4097 domain-containing protein [Actinomycetota bacterium]NIU64092.1 DUF4097 domain-containing protein [Actinomycetota bacterium]
DISLSRIGGRSVEVATGSGDVSAREMRAEGVEIATGSGDVEVGLDQLSDGEFQIATGSGDIDLTLTDGSLRRRPRRDRSG